MKRNYLNPRLSVLAYNCGIGAASTGCENGPKVIKNSNFFEELHTKLQIDWKDIHVVDTNASKLEQIHQINTDLALAVKDCREHDEKFLVLGGDHSSAIGTWSGATTSDKPTGLLWIDAHMDSNTFATSPSNNIHGMPVAMLLGAENNNLSKILYDTPKIDPRYTCIIGVRSYDAEEKQLLDSLGVTIFYMQDITDKSLHDIFIPALHQVKAAPGGFGISIDIDAIDPKDAPGTGYRVENGINADELITELEIIASLTRFIGAEIVEFDPTRDLDRTTEKLVIDLIKQMYICKDIL